MQHLAGAKIKNLQVLITKKELEQEQLNREFKELQSKKDKLKHQLQKYNDEIKKLTSPQGRFIVSEHALLRYLQRVYELDLSKIEKEILTPETQEKIAELGNGTYPGEGFSIKVVDGVVVTIIGDR